MKIVDTTHQDPYWPIEEVLNMVDEKLLPSPRQVIKRLKLQGDNPKRVRLFSSIHNYYDYYISFIKNNERVYVKLALFPYKLGLITEHIEFLIKEGHIEWEGRHTIFKCGDKNVYALPQRYVDDENEVKFNKRTSRFSNMGHLTVEAMPPEISNIDLDKYSNQFPD